MAFNTKLNKKGKKRFSSRDGSEQETTEECSCGCGNFPKPCPWGIPFKKSNVVATQSWVWNILNKAWNWTKFFATQSLQVAGGMTAGKV